MQLLERYNKALMTTEDGTIRLLNNVLDRSFNRLVRRSRAHMRLGMRDPAQRSVLLLQEFRELVPAVRPNKVDAYDRLFRNLASEASRLGIVSADSLTGELLPTRPRVDVSVPIEATVAAASQAKGYLRRHGEQFAQTSAEVVAQGIAEGRPTDTMVRDMRDRLSVVKSRATTIVRTESIRAYSDAGDYYYSAQGIDLVMYYATSDDRTCPVCRNRAGRVYKRTELKLPLHPQCRCAKAPYDPELAAIDPEYANIPYKHRQEVEKHSGISLSDDLTKAVFEARTPVPVI
jgi:SPP1 gp7 family putative phage head morphogenesis protein